MEDLTKATLGQNVIYTDHEGQDCAATVILCAGNYDPEKAHGAPLSENAVGLRVFRPSGRSYSRFNVPQFGSPEHQAAVEAKIQYDEAAGSAPAEDEENDSDSLSPKVRSWRPLDA